MRDTITLKSFSNFLTLLLAIAGIFVTIALTYEKIRPAADIGCRRLGGDCTGTINSKYGHVGPIPTSVFGLGAYLVIAGLCVGRLKLLRARRAAELSRANSYAGVTDSPETAEEQPDGPADDPTLRLRRDIRLIDGALWVIAAVAIGTSWWLQYVSLWVILQFCPFCMTSAVLVTLIFLLTTYDFLIEGRKLDGEQKLLAGITAFIVLCFGMVFAPVFVQRVTIMIQARQAADNRKPRQIEVSKRSLILVDYLPYRGDPKAKYTMIEFADYQCPHCKAASAKVEELLKHPPTGPVRFGFRNFPLDNHQSARPAAVAAEAAGEQGKFWEMHDLIFKHQDELGKPEFTYSRFDDWAKELGLNVERFRKDSGSPKITERVANDHVAGAVTGLEITPSFYIITPTQITVLSGIEKLEEVWRDPKNKAWK